MKTCILCEAPDRSRHTKKILSILLDQENERAREKL